MSLIINHNMMAANAARNLSVSYKRLATSTRRLSSGLRVGQASDDAAGLAVRELMRAEIAALNQGVRNANDAISMLQTADGALQIIDEKLIRMKELAEQAATGTYSDDQRKLINQEFTQMRSEIDRIANATEFNEKKLINGSLSTATGIKIHFGANNTKDQDYYYISIGNSTASGLKINSLATSSQDGAQKALVAIKAAITSKDAIRANLGAMQNRLENTVSNLQIQAENLQAAESRISDVDVATEMTEFVRNQILSQAAVAMLSQANSLPRMAMQLLGGN